MEETDVLKINDDDDDDDNVVRVYTKTFIFTVIIPDLV